MTVSLNMATVIEAIADLDVTGADILDSDEMPDSATGRKALIVPMPTGFISDFESTRMAQGSMGAAPHDVMYTLNYRLLHSRVGTKRGLFKTYPELITVLVAFINAILNNDVVSGLVDLQLYQVLNFGMVSGPNEDDYYGCDFALKVLEHQD